MSFRHTKTYFRQTKEKVRTVRGSVTEPGMPGEKGFDILSHDDGHRRT